MVSRKNFTFRKSEIVYSYPIPFPQEGRFAVVTDVGSGMRWTLWRQARDERVDE